MSVALQIRLLGGFRLDVGGVAVTALGAARVQSLLAYLLLHRDAPQRRQRIAFLFWPDSSETQARTNLRQLLHYLRRDLPGAEAFLQVDAKMVKWCWEAPLSLDVADFEAALSRAEHAADSAARVAYLAKAVSHYGGELLPGCYDDWLVPKRERLRGQFLAALETLTHLCEEARDYPAALRYTERLLQSDPLRESAYRQTMRLYALSGDRAKALHVYPHLRGCLAARTRRRTERRQPGGVRPARCGGDAARRPSTTDVPQTPHRSSGCLGAPLVSLARRSRGRPDCMHSG